VRHRSRATLAIVGLAVLLTACASADAEDAAVATPSPTADTASSETVTPAATDAAADSATPTSDASADPTGDVPANAAALDFQARRLDGGTLDGQQLAGGDVVLWMWAPWCPQCNREAPHVAEAVAAFGDEVTFVGVAGHDTDEAHRAFVEEHGLDRMVTLVDDDGSLWAQYDVSYQPAWVFVNQDGEVTRVAGGLYEDLDDRLQALVDA
jgi:peroxiredoxin